MRLGQLLLEAAREEMEAQRGTQDCPLHVLPMLESSPVQTGPYPFYLFLVLTKQYPPMAPLRQATSSPAWRRGSQRGCAKGERKAALLETAPKYSHLAPGSAVLGTYHSAKGPSLPISLLGRTWRALWLCHLLASLSHHGHLRILSAAPRSFPSP